MIYSIVLFVVLFVATFIIHKPLNVHKTQKLWFQKAHFWLEHLVVIQAAIIVNELLGLIK